MKKFTELLTSEEILTKGNIISSGSTKLMAVGEIEGINRHIDVYYFPVDIYPFAILFLTGSGPFNKEMRFLANKKGYSLSEKNLSKGSASGPIVKSDEIFKKIGKNKIETEEDIFKFLGFPYVPPNKRESGVLTI